MINGDAGAWRPHPYRLAERGGGVDREDRHGQPSCQRPGEDPATNTLVVPPIDHAQYLPGVLVPDRRHPRLMPDPRAGVRVAEKPALRGRVLS